MASPSEEDTLLEPVGALIARPPVTCLAGAPLRQALETMQRSMIGSVVITAADGSPEGIFTERDLLRLAAAGTLDTGAPIGSVMTRNLASLPASASVYDAAQLMVRRGIRHVLVVDQGVLKGVVSERSLFALELRSMRHAIHAIEVAEDIEGLKLAAHEIRGHGRDMLNEGVAAEHLTQIVSALNDRLAQRIVELEAQRHAISDVSWCWLALGSEGRQEQTLSTDQDNAIIFEAGDEEEARAVLLPFAKAVNATLDACGYPLCPGNIMAGNPECCLSARGWRERFAVWVRTPTPEALLGASTFFDFRGIAGDIALAEELRSWIRELVAGGSLFFKLLALNALDTPVPLGLFERFTTGGDGADAGTVDIKAQGTRLITDAARVYALSKGVDATNTAARLRGAGGLLGMSQAEVEAIVEAFYQLLLLRFRGRAGGGSVARSPNRVAPRELNEFDRRMLKESLFQARRLQQRLALDYRR